MTAAARRLCEFTHSVFGRCRLDPGHDDLHAGEGEFQEYRWGAAPTEPAPGVLSGDRCAFSGLLPSGCAHCTGRTGGG